MRRRPMILYATITMRSSPVRPEDQLLVCIARRNLDQLTMQSIKHLLGQPGFDWEYLSRSAAAHGVLPLLTYHLQSLAVPAIPQTKLESLQKENQQNTEFSFWLAGELVKIVKALQTRGVPCVPFKGPTLALIAYGDIGLRQFSDLDLFVRRSDFTRAKAILAELGFKLVRNLDAAREAALLRFDYAMAFVNHRDVLLDVHWRFAPAHSSFGLESDNTWERLESVDIGGQSVSTFSAEELFLILCCHGFTHDWERLVWICDLANLIERPERQLDWDYLRRRAERSGVLRIMMLGVALAQMLGASVPAEASDGMRDATAVEEAERLMGALFTPDRSGLASYSLKRQMRMRERFTDKLVTLSRQVFTPRDYDCSFAPLPFASLYYLLRPVRMAMKLF